MKIMPKIIIGLIIIATITVIADYFGLLGLRTKKVLAFSELIIMPVDKHSKAPIYDARAVCFRHGNHDICTNKQGRKAEKSVTVQFPVHKVQENTWLFQKSEEPVLPAEPNFKIMVMQQNYEKITQDFNMIDIHENSGQVVRIEMKPLAGSNEVQVDE